MEEVVKKFPMEEVVKIICYGGSDKLDSPKQYVGKIVIPMEKVVKKTFSGGSGKKIFSGGSGEKNFYGGSGKNNFLIAGYSNI